MPLFRRLALSAVKAAAATLAAALIVVGGAVVPVNAVVQYSVSGHVDLGLLGVSAGTNKVSVYLGRAGTTAVDFIYARSAYTNASGDYVIPGVNEGEYSLWFRYVGNDQGFASKFWSNADTAATATPFQVSGDVTGKDALLPAYPMISGVVSLGSAGNHPAGVNAHVTWERQTTWSWEAGPQEGVYTDANGAYSFRAAPGVYRIHVYATADYDYLYVQRPGSENQADPTLITMGTSALAGQNITLPLLGAISGHVYLGNSSVSAGAGDVRISWLNCAVQSCYASGSDPSVLTDALGNFVIPRMGNASWTLTFTYLRDSAFQSFNQRPVATISNYVNVTVPSVTLLPTASISGHVSLGSPATAAGAGSVTITAYLYSTVWNQWLAAGTVPTDAAGNYTISGLTAGSTRLRFHHNSSGEYSDLWWLNAVSASTSSSFPVTSTALTGYNVTMQPGVSFTGVLRNSLGAALTDFTVIAHRYAASGSAELDQYQVENAADGSFAFTGLPAGRYLVEVYQNAFNPPIGRQWIGAVGYAPTPDLSKAILMTAGDQHPFGDVTLLRTARVTGEITCGGCGKAGYSSLYFLDPTRGWVAAGPGTGNYIGYYSLLPGTYTLRAGFQQDSPYALYVSEPFTLSEGEVVTRNVALVAGTLPIGRLVKSNAVGATEVYLVDGLSRLVPVSSISAATDAGVPAAVIAVSPPSLAGYSITAPLSNMIQCYGYLDYFASGGRLWAIDWSLATGWAKTTLVSSTCQTLPVGDHWINGAVFLKSSTGSTTYYITPAGEKRTVTGWLSMVGLSYPYSPEVLPTTNQFLASLPSGEPIYPHGKQPSGWSPTGSWAPGPAAVPAHLDVEPAPAMALGTDELAACYSELFEAIGVGLFAPFARTVTLSTACSVVISASR